MDLNQKEALELKTLNQEFLADSGFNDVVDALSTTSDISTQDLDNHINQIGYKVSEGVLGDTNEPILEEQQQKIVDLLKEMVKSSTQKMTKLRDIRIDPDTSKESDKHKTFLTLRVELIEEGIRINEMKDKNGNLIKEIIFE